MLQEPAAPDPTESGARCVQQPFTDADHVGRDQDLVDHLGVLAGAGAALMHDVATHDLQQRAHGLDRRLVPTDHDRERGLPGADIAPADRGVNARHPDRRGSLGDLPGQARAAGGHVHDKRRRLRGRQRSRRTQVHGLDILRVPDDGEGDVGALGAGGGRVGPACPTLQERLGLQFRTGVHGQAVAGLNQVARHGGPHDPGADPSDAVARGGHSDCVPHERPLVGRPALRRQKEIPRPEPAGGSHVSGSSSSCRDQSHA
jgi:hypothetical protein